MPDTETDTGLEIWNGNAFLKFTPQEYHYGIELEVRTGSMKYECDEIVAYLTRMATMLRSRQKSGAESSHSLELDAALFS